MARQSSLSPMRAGAHFFLAEPLSQFPLWHLADIRICSADVRFLLDNRATEVFGTNSSKRRRSVTFVLPVK
jgi:hypothetical protein